MKYWDIKNSLPEMQAQIFRGKIIEALSVEFFFVPLEVLKQPVPSTFFPLLPIKKAESISIPQWKKIVLKKSTPLLSIPSLSKKILQKTTVSIDLPSLTKKTPEKSSLLPEKVSDFMVIFPPKNETVSPQNTATSAPIEPELQKREQEISSGVKKFFSPPLPKTPDSANDQKVDSIFSTEQKIEEKKSFDNLALINNSSKNFVPRFQKTKKFLKESVHFLILASLIFGVAFGAVNFHALKTVIVAKVNPEAAAEKTSDLETLLTEKKFAPLLPIAGAEKNDRKQFPLPAISITPLENRIVIPKIGRNVPIAEVSTNAIEEQDWKKLEQDIQDSLREGVVHYPGTADPGERGNFFVTGHSSYYVWDSGKYKDVFALLHDLNVGDEYTVFWNQNVYKYRITERKVVPPTDTSVLDQPTDKRISTLMTCTPVGTTKDRLILVAEEIE